MNNDQAFIFEREDFKDNWHTGKYFSDYVTINSDEVFNLSSVYKNQVEDVHPPLYYLLLRIFASFTINNFTKWTGLILNLIIFVFCAIMVYKIGKKLLKNTNYSLLLVILYGFSLFSMQNTTYIRMYQLLELELLMLVYWHIKNFNKELTKKELIKLGILVITGFLTHYYYAVFAIGIYIVNMLQYIKEKQWKNILKYNIALIISAILAIIIFPACLKHIFEGYRGKDSVNKLKNPDSTRIIFNTLKVYMQLTLSNMFNIVDAKYIGILTLALIPILLIRKRKLDDRIMYLVGPTVLYFILIILSAPYTDLRYIVSIMIFIVIAMFYILKNELQVIIKNKKIAFIIITVMVIICSVPTPHNEKFQYIYYGNKKTIEKLKEYKDVPCIYIYIIMLRLLKTILSQT